MNRYVLAALPLLMFTGCKPGGTGATPQKRAELRVLNGSTIEVAPGEGQLPFCLLFTITDHGKPPIIRQLTMTHENKSVPCEANRAIGGISYRVPIEEGKVRVLTFFSDSKLVAGSVAQQMYELAANNPRWNTLDLRLPGKVHVESLEFDPQPDRPVASGSVVGSGGDLQADAGQVVTPTPAGDAGVAP